MVRIAPIRDHCMHLLKHTEQCQDKCHCLKSQLLAEHELASPKHRHFVAPLAEMFATAKRCVRRAPSDDSDHQIMSPRSGSAHGKKCVPPLRKRCCRLSLRPASSGSHAGAPSGMADAVAHPHIEPGHARGSDCLKSKLPKIEAVTLYRSGTLRHAVMMS